MFSSVRARRRRGSRAAVLALLAALAGSACDSKETPGIVVPGAEAPAIGYPSAAVLLQVGVATAPLVPEVAGAVTSFSVTPDLPAGLALDVDAGVISGVPQAVQPPTVFTVTAEGPGGTGEFPLTIEVRERFTAPRAAIGVQFDPPRIVHWRIDALSGRLVPGASTTTLAAPFRAAVHPSGEWALVAHLSGFATAYRLAAGSHAPTLLNIANLGPGLFELEFDPTGRFVYASVHGSGRIAHLVFDPATGALLPGTGDLIAPGVTDLLLSPDGTRLFAASSVLGVVGVLELDPVSGAIVALVDLEPAGEPYRLALDPTGSWLVAASFGTDALVRFAVDANGALEPAGEVPVAERPIDLVFDAGGTNLRVASFKARRVSNFAFDPATGALALTSSVSTGARPPAIAAVDAGATAAVVPLFDDGAVARIATGGAPGSEALEIAEVVGAGPSSAHVVVVRGATAAFLLPGPIHVAEQAAGRVSSHEALLGTAQIVEVAPPLVAGTSPSALALDADATQLAVTSELSSDLRVFPLEEGVPSGPAATQPTPFLARDVASTRDGRLLFTATSQGVQSFLVINGQPTPVSLLPAGDSPVAVALSVDERFLFAAARGNGALPAFRVGADGALTPVAGPVAGSGLTSEPRALAVSPDGKHLYVVQSALNRISTYAIHPASGQITLTHHTFTSPDPRDVAVSPDGRYVATVDVGLNRVTVFRREADGSLVSLGFTPVGVAPRALAFDPSGLLLATVSHFADVLELRTFSKTTGALAPFAFAPLGAGARPVDVVIAPRWEDGSP